MEKKTGCRYVVAQVEVRGMELYLVGRVDSGCYRLIRLVESMEFLSL
jgi:hypothetical protein